MPLPSRRPISATPRRTAWRASGGRERRWPWCASAKLRCLPDSSANGSPRYAASWAKSAHRHWPPSSPCYQEFADPDALALVGLSFCRLGEPARALAALERAAELGFSFVEPLERDPWLDPLRGEPAFVEIVAGARQRAAEAAAIFSAAGGERLLGLDPTLPPDPPTTLAG